MFKKISTVLCAAVLLTTAIAYATTAQPTVPNKANRYRQLLRSMNATSSTATELQAGIQWADLVTQGPEYTITFDRGASKGYAALTQGGLAYSTTAAAVNKAYFGPYSLTVVPIATATGTITPNTTATGLDINAGSPGNNDSIAVFGGLNGASGRPFVIGQDAAFKFCARIKFHDVSGSDGTYVAVRQVGAAVILASYSDYCAIGNVSGTIDTNDKTNGAVTTTDTVADDGTKTLCVLVTAGGVCTYTNEGAAPAATTAHTLADGILVVPEINLINDVDIADQTNVVSWVVQYQATN